MVTIPPFVAPENAAAHPASGFCIRGQMFVGADDIRGDVGLRRGVHRLEKSFAENTVINYRPIDKPTEARRTVNLPAPFRGPGWSEKNEMLKTKERFGLAVAFLLFQERAQRK